MAHLKGSSESAEAVAAGIYTTAKTLNALIAEQSKNLASLEQSSRDMSFGEMEYLTHQTILNVEHLLTPLALVHKRLRAYRDFIASLEGENHEAVCLSLEAGGISREIQGVWLSGYRSATVKQHGRQWSGQLSENCRSSIHAYTGSAYMNINGVLRGKAPAFQGDNGRIAADIHNALQSSEIPCDCVVYRGMDAAALGDLADCRDEELVGAIYTDNGFMSTSLSREDTFGGSVRLEIRVPKGANGAYVGYISQHGHTESEVLFDMGQYIRITGVKRDAYGNRILTAEMMVE